MKILYSVVIFQSGFNACCNLSGLIPTNPDFQAEWWKFTASLVVGCVFTGLILKKGK